MSDWFSFIRNARRRLCSSRVRRFRLSDTPALEVLESRVLLTAATWDSPDQLTLSLPADGTDVYGQSSSLFAAYAAIGDRAALQDTILRAFQTWAVHANVNVGLVDDGGQAFGIGGATQGDPRFGDIRAAAIPMSTDVLALSVPRKGNLSGTWAGDMLFNSAVVPATIDDFFAIALHEAGHALGLEHSSDPASPMFAHNQPGVSVLPTSTDISALKSLHGNRFDPGEPGQPNDTIDTATRIKYSSFDGTTPLLSFGDLSAVSDVDFYRLKKLSNYAGTITFELHADGISQVAGQLEVFDERGSAVGRVENIVPGERVSLTVDANEDSDYYVRVWSDRNDIFAVGRYTLVTRYDTTLVTPTERIDAAARGDFDFLGFARMRQLLRNGIVPRFNHDFHLNDTFLTATSLDPTPGFDDQTRYEFAGNISDPTDVDVYSFKSADTRGPRVMTVTVRSATQQQLIPAVTVYNRFMNAVPATVLANGDGTFSVQVANTQRNRTYFVVVESGATVNRYRRGNYHLDIRFGSETLERTRIVSGTIHGTDARDYFTLDVEHTQLFSFALAATSTALKQQAAQFTIFDDAGKEIYRLVSRTGDLRTSNSILLPAGRYTIRLNANAKNGSPATHVAYELSAFMIGDPVGPIGTNPTSDPPPACDTELCIDLSTELTLPPPEVTNQEPLEDPWQVVPDPDEGDVFVDFADWYWYTGIA